MSKILTNTIRHTGGSADNITLDGSQNVTIEGNLTVDGTSTLTGAVTGDNGGTCVLVGRTVISSGSSHEIDIEDTALFDGTYDRILLSFTGMRLATDEGYINGRLKYGGSYQTSSHYSYHSRQYKDNSIDVHSGTSSYNNNNSQLLFMKECGNATGETWSLHVNIYNPGSTAVWKMLEWSQTFAQKDSRHYVGFGGGHYHNTSTGQGALQGFKLWTNDASGNTNITDGIINKYGWKTS